MQRAKRLLRCLISSLSNMLSFISDTVLQSKLLINRVWREDEKQGSLFPKPTNLGDVRSKIARFNQRSLSTITFLLIIFVETLAIIPMRIVGEKIFSIILARKISIFKLFIAPRSFVRSNCANDISVR